MSLSAQEKSTCEWTCPMHLMRSTPALRKSGMCWVLMLEVTLLLYLLWEAATSAPLEEEAKRLSLLDPCACLLLTRPVSPSLPLSSAPSMATSHPWASGWTVQGASTWYCLAERQVRVTKTCPQGAATLTRPAMAVRTPRITRARQRSTASALALPTIEDVSATVLVMPKKQKWKGSETEGAHQLRGALVLLPRPVWPCRWWTARGGRCARSAASTVASFSWTTSCSPSTWAAMASASLSNATSAATAARTATSSPRTSSEESTKWAEPLGSGGGGVGVGTQAGRVFQSGKEEGKEGRTLLSDDTESSLVCTRSEGGHTEHLLLVLVNSRLSIPKANWHRHTGSIACA